MEGVFCESDPSGSVRGRVGESRGKVDGGVCMPGPSLSTSCVFWCSRPHRLRPKGSAFRFQGFWVVVTAASSVASGTGDAAYGGVQYNSGKQLSSHCHGNIQSVTEDNNSVNRAPKPDRLVPS